MSLNVLFVSDEMIKDRTAIHGNIDPKLIYPDIKLAQDMYILPILGTALFDKIQGYISAETLSSHTDYKTLVDNYIADALIYFTLSELPTTISYQFWNKGVMRKQNENAELPSMTDLMDISNKYKNRAEFYANRLELYIKQNATAKFPEYNTPGTGIDTINPSNNSFSSPLYLGDDEYCIERYKPYHE